MADPIKWYAVHTAPRGEFFADANLRRQGFYTFLPFDRIRKRRKLPNREQYEPYWIEAAHFPRYIFVAMRGRPGESFGAINDTDGVSCVVSIRGKPLRIPAAVMDEIIEAADKRGMLTSEDWTQRERFKPGDGVVFAEGSPLAGFLAFVRLDDGKKVRLWCDRIAGEIVASPDILKRSA